MAPTKDWTDLIEPYSRMRVELWCDTGSVEAFRIQLEYDHGHRYTRRDPESDWCAVARFDHTPNSSTGGHDITEEGVHLDLYRKDNQYRTEEMPIPAVKGHLDATANACQEWLRENHDSLIEAYEKRSDVPRTRRRIY